MFLKFLPNEFNFFNLFDKQAANAVKAAAFFKELVAKGSVGETDLQKMKDIEHEGDKAAYEIIDHLNKTFITPFDREDIHTLTKELDDITDMIYTIVNRLKVYKATGIDKTLVEFAIIIEKSIHEVASAVKGLRNAKHTRAILASCLEVNRLENVGDSMRDEMLGELFEKSKDPIHIMKWKEIYQDAETILDICEDVAHVVEAILVKQA